MTERRGLLTVDESWDNGGVVLRLNGELDLTSVPLLDDAFDRMTQGYGDDVVLDLTELTFIDSTGLGALVRVTRDRRAQGGNVILRRPQHAVRVVIDVTGLNRVLDIERGG